MLKTFYIGIWISCSIFKIWLCFKILYLLWKFVIKNICLIFIVTSMLLAFLIPEMSGICKWELLLKWKKKKWKKISYNCSLLKNLQYYVMNKLQLLQKEKQMMRNGAMDKNPKQENQVLRNLDINLKTLL